MDWQDYFLRNAFPYEPGTRFEYNNFNSYMCSCIVERAAGCTLKDYMTPRFFDKLGIGNPDWLTCPMGHSAGANGLFLSIDEMLRLFLLDEPGRRILPRRRYVWSVHRGGAQEQSGGHGAGAGQ